MSKKKKTVKKLKVQNQSENESPKTIVKRRNSKYPNQKPKPEGQCQETIVKKTKFKKT